MSRAGESYKSLTNTGEVTPEVFSHVTLISSLLSIDLELNMTYIVLLLLCTQLLASTNALLK